MNQGAAHPGQIVDLWLDPASLASPQQQLLVRTPEVQITHLIVPAGAELPTHQAQGAIILHCLEGQVEIAALEEEHSLAAGQLLHLSVNEPFSIRGIQDASLLATIIEPKQGPNVELVGS